MKVLFVCSGNSVLGMSHLIYNQGESLKVDGISLDYCTIKGKGVLGYLRNLNQLRKTISTGKYDLIHSHFSLTAFLTTLVAFSVPHCVSLMGSDSKMGSFHSFLIRLCSKYFWDITILKSEDMNKQLKLNKYTVIPNGVNLKLFTPIEKTIACKKVGFNPNNLNITFLSDPSRLEKNFKLANESIKLLKDNHFIDFHIIHDAPDAIIPYYLNATDILVLTSFHEGSPNVIKEAMSCNCPIVSTNVGDVEWVFGNTNGCYLSSYNAAEFAGKIHLAIEYSSSYGRTKGREQIIELGLDSESTSKRLIDVYKKVLRNY